MGKTYLQHGRVLDMTAPSGGVVVDTPYQVGSLCGVAAVTAAEGEKFPFDVAGVHLNMPKTAGATWSEGTPLYFDPGTGKFTTVAGSLKKVAIAVAAAASADITGTLLLVQTV